MAKKDKVKIKEALKIATQNPSKLTKVQKQLLIKNGLDDFVRGGKTQSPMGDLAMLGLTGAAVKNPLKALEVIGTDPNDHRELSLEAAMQKGAMSALNPISKIKRLGKGVSRTWDAVNTAMSPRQLATVTPGANPLKISNEGSELVGALNPNRRIINPNRPLSKGLMSELTIRNDAIAKAKANFEKWEAYAKQVKAEGGKLKGSESMGLTGAKRKLQDISSSPLQTTVARWFGAMGEKGYGVKGTKGVPGGKPAKGSGLDQHHLAPSREMYNMSQQTAMQVDLGFRVNTHQYLASKGVLPGWGKANMINIKAKPHRYELHPMLRSMGFERFWKDILKADPTLAAKDPNKFYDLIDQWHETVLTPSIQMANDAAMKGNTKQFVINKNELILPPTVRRQMEKKTKSILDQAKQSYIDDLKIDSNRPSLFRNNLDAPPPR